MAPLKNKLNNTLHKINEKFKRQPGLLTYAHGCDTAHAKQPRTVPTDSFLRPPSQSSAPTEDAVMSSLTGEHESQLPRTSGSGSAMSVSQNSAYGFAAPSPGSSMSLDFLDKRPVAAQSAGSPPGTLANPIDLTGNSNPPTGITTGDFHNPIVLASTPSPRLPKGQKRDWIEPSFSEFMDLDNDIDQKGKMYQHASNHQADVATLRYYGIPSTFAAQADADLERQLFDDDLRMAQALHNKLNPEAPAMYRSEDDLVDFGKKLAATACSRCSVPLFGCVGDIVARTKDLLDLKGVLHPHVTCAKCKVAECVACKSQSRQPEKDLPFKRTGSRIKVAWCCDEGRLFLIWSLCCGPEFKKLEGHNNTATFGRLLKDKLKSTKPDSATPGKATDIRPKALSKGIGYGGAEMATSSGGIHWDAQFSDGGRIGGGRGEKLLAAYFSALRLLLPSFEDGQQPTSFENDPPAMLEFMLRRSPLLPKAAELLRNDSIEAMSTREDIYEPLLGLIGTISRHTSTSAVVYSDYIIYPLEEQLVHFSTSLSSGGSRSNHRGKGKQVDLVSSVVKIVANLAKQCQHLTQVASAHMDEFRTGESSQMLALSRIVCDLAAEHEANQVLLAEHQNSTIPGSSVPKLPVSNVLTRSKEAEKAGENLRELHRNASVIDLPDDEILTHFNFRLDALDFDAANAANGRMKKLVAQIANLRTSLPEGIWVRHGSSRPDVMKVLMVGPRGTPYEYGLFEFDLFCPAEFPNKPPSMFFRTTGGGRVRFNPNLYEDGKVCLSILGTWPGETWNPAYSTLLQVLVSIQGMILVDQPWYNEPGRECTPSKSASKSYNSEIQRLTMQHAMISWLNDRLALDKLPSPSMANGSSTAHMAPPTTVTWSSANVSAGPSNGGYVKDDPIWGEIVRKHFTANGKVIMEAVRKWKQSPKGKELVVELQEALTRHGFL